MGDVTVTHPLVLDSTPDEPLPRRVTVERDGTNYRELVDKETGTFSGTEAVAEALAAEWDVDVVDLVENPNRCQAMTDDGDQCKNTAEEGSDYCYLESHGE